MNIPKTTKKEGHVKAIVVVAVTPNQGGSVMDPDEVVMPPIVKIIRDALVASPTTETVTVEDCDGWFIAVRDVDGNDLTVEVF